MSEDRLPKNPGECQIGRHSAIRSRYWTTTVTMTPTTPSPVMIEAGSVILPCAAHHAPARPTDRIGPRVNPDFILCSLRQRSCLVAHIGAPTARPLKQAASTAPAIMSFFILPSDPINSTLATQWFQIL